MQEANLGSPLSAQDANYPQPVVFILLHLSLHAPQACVLPPTASISEQRPVNGCCPDSAGRKSWTVQPEKRAQHLPVGDVVSGLETRDSLF